MPSSIHFDAAVAGHLFADQRVVVPTTEAGSYFILARGGVGTDFELTARLLPFAIADVSPGVLEVALTDSETGESLLSPPDDLSQTDAVLNIQPGGEIFMSAEVTVRERDDNGTTVLDVSIDVSDIPPGTEATIHFDLIGFAEADSIAVIDDVQLLLASDSWQNPRDRFDVNDEAVREKTDSLARPAIPAWERLWKDLRWLHGRKGERRLAGAESGETAPLERTCNNLDDLLDDLALSICSRWLD